MATQYKKHFLPLESNPDVFNTLLELLGAPSTLLFRDVWSLDDLELIPRPALALVLVFPTDEHYETRAETYRAENKDTQDTQDTIWFKQTINNACGLYAILHAVANSAALEMLDPSSLISNIIDSAHLSPEDRAAALEQSKELEDAYATVARQGTSRIPENARDGVDFHYICFVKSRTNGRLFELDGDLPGPVDRCIALGPDEDILASESLDLVREYMQKGEGNTKFSLMVLVNL